MVDVQCETCGTSRSGLLALVGLGDVRVRRFFEDHGFDPLAGSWSFALAFLDASERVLATDPVDYEASWILDGERLRVRIDGDGRVQAVDRDEPRETPSQTD